MQYLNKLNSMPCIFGKSKHDYRLKLLFVRMQQTAGTNHGLTTDEIRDQVNFESVHTELQLIDYQSNQQRFNQESRKVRTFACIDSNISNK